MARFRVTDVYVLEKGDLFIINGVIEQGVVKMGTDLGYEDGRHLTVDGTGLGARIATSNAATLKVGRPDFLLETLIGDLLIGEFDK